MDAGERNYKKITWKKQKEGTIREGRDIKREKWEDFWAGVCAPREGGSPETRVPGHREAPSQAAPRGAVKFWKTRQSRDLEGSKQRTPPFPAC